MWRLHRYYLKELAINFGITFLVMFAIVLVSAVTRGINRAQGGGLGDALLIALLMAVDSFPHLLTIAFLVATVLTYARAAQARELTALRAAGIGPRVAMVPAVLLGLMLTVLASFANHYVIPEVHYMKYRVIPEVVRNIFMNLKLGGDRIAIPEGGVMLFGAKDGPDTFVDCTIYLPQDRIAELDGVESPILRVDRVSIPRVSEDQGAITVILYGVRDPAPNVDSAGNELAEIRMYVPLHDIADRGRRADRDADLQSDQLLGEVMRDAHPRPQNAIYTLFRRCCFSLLPALLAPIGFCIAELMRDRGRVLALVASLAPLAMFYVGEFLGARVMAETDSAWAAWMPVALLVLIGTPICWKRLAR